MITLMPEVSAPDALVRTVSARGGIAVRAVVGTAFSRVAAERHAAAPVGSVALGRALMGAVLLAASGKHGERVQLQFRGNGPLGTLTAIGDAEGRVRGYAAHPEATTGTPGLDVASAVGCGVLAVVRHRADGRAPYNGIVPLTKGTIAQDLAHYLTESEQMHSAVGLGVFLGEDGSVCAAGGFHVHALPDADDEEIELAEANVRGFPGPGELVREGVDADGIVDRLLAGLGSRDRTSSRPVFHCGCTRDRVLRAVGLLGRDELSTVARDGEEIEVRCHFCNERYVVSPQEIDELVGARSG